MFQWVRQHPTLLTWLGVGSVVMAAAGVLLVPWLVARLPVGFFVREGPPPGSWRERHPVGAGLLRFGRNLLGILLVLAGIAMLVLPGQGILTIVLGLGLLDVPGRRRLEGALVRRRAVARALQWMRRRAGKPPLDLPASRPADGEAGA